MDKFAEWIKKKWPNRSGQSAAEIADDFPFTCEAWRESAKQKDAEIDGLKATIENLEMSVKSFADSSVDLVARKREQYGDLPSEVLITLRHARTFITSRQQMHKAGVKLHDDLINRIEKDSNERT